MLNTIFLITGFFVWTIVIVLAAAYVSSWLLDKLLDNVKLQKWFLKCMYNFYSTLPKHYQDYPYVIMTFDTQSRTFTNHVKIDYRGMDDDERKRYYDELKEQLGRKQL